MRLMERDAQRQSRVATSAAQYVTSMLKLCLEAAQRLV